MWVYGNRRGESFALLVGAVASLALSQALEGIGGVVATWARWAAVALAAVLAIAAGWLYIKQRG